MSEKKKLSRNEMRTRIRLLEKDVEQLTSRLQESTRELKLHAAWCDMGVKRPGAVQTWMNRMWVKLTRQLNA